MNGLDLAALLNGLPDEMIVSANTNTYSSAESPAEQSAAKDVAVQPEPIIVSAPFRRHTPSVFSGIVAAACLLFTVGFGAVMLHGNQDDLISQNSQVDSLLEEVTAVTTSAQSTTAAPETVTALHTEQTDTTAPEAGTTLTVTTPVTSEASVPVETESAESTASAEMQTAALPPETETSVSVTESETTTAAATTEPPEPHRIMQMTSAEEVEREGNRMVGEYARRIAELNGEIDADAPRITTEEVAQMIDEGMEFRAVLQRLHELYPYPDYIGGSGVTNIEYWLDISGTDFILLTIESESVVHIVHHSDGSADVYDILTRRR